RALVAGSLRRDRAVGGLLRELLHPAQAFFLGHLLLLLTSARAGARSRLARAATSAGRRAHSRRARPARRCWRRRGGRRSDPGWGRSGTSVLALVEVVTAQRPGQGDERVVEQVGVVGGATKGRVDDRHLGGGGRVGGDVGVRLAVGVAVGTLDAAV